MTAEQKLAELGIELPPPPAAVANYEPVVRSGNLLFVSGQLPWRGGQLAYTGKIDNELSEAEGFKAARLCAINAISQLKTAVGDLEKITRIVRLEGFVHAGPGYAGHPKVLNGASELFNEVFGPRGRHARVALGINEMPLNAAVQISLIVEVAP